MVSIEERDNLDEEDVVSVAYYIYRENEFRKKEDFKKGCKKTWEEEFFSLSWDEIWSEIVDYL